MYMKNKIIFSLIFTTVLSTSFSQQIESEIGSIITDRPDQTEAPALTPHKWVQIEVGTQTESDKVGNNEVTNSLYPTILWKYGASKRFEFRLITQYGNVSSKMNGFTSKQEGFSPILVGSKIAICEENKFIPQISFISHLELPWIGNEAFRPVNIIPSYRFVFSHTLTEKLNLSYNLGMEWEDGTSVSTSIYTVSLAAALFENVGFFAESYGFLRENSMPDHRIDAGFTYLINDNNQLDISAGLGLSEISPNYFISCGYSFRLNTQKK